MVKNFKLMSSYFILVLTLVAPQLSHAMEMESNEKELSDLPLEVKHLIVKQAAYKQCLEEKNLVNLVSVCRMAKYYQR